MGLLDRLRPPPLFGSGPLLLLPSGTDPMVLDALVEAWAPGRCRKGDAWELAPGLRWAGPHEVAGSEAADFDLPLGHLVAYVAVAKRDRGDGVSDRLLRRMVSRGIDRTIQEFDDELVASGATTHEALAATRAEEDARDARDYPQGAPEGAEWDGWNLVCGLARRLDGLCRLPDGRFFLPELVADVGEVTLYARTLLDPDEVAEILEPALGRLVLEQRHPGGEDDDDDDDEWLLVRGTGEDEVSIAASIWERDLELRTPLDPLACFDGTGGRTVEYAFEGPPGSEPLLARACSLLAPPTYGIVLDGEGFPATLGTGDAN